MEKQFYIHIGTHKTGTTSLQKMLVWNRSYLKSIGLLYPKKCTWRGAHHNLSWQLKADARVNVSKYGSISELIAEIDDNFQSICLLSSEDMSIFKLKHKKELKTYFKKYNPKIIVYIRNQYDYIASCWSTHIKHEAVGMKFNQYYKFYMKERMDRLNYLQFLDEWADVFGKANLIVKIYNKNLGEHLHEDFIRLFKLPINLNKLKLPERSNTSLAFEKLNIIRAINNSNLRLTYDKRTKFIETLLREIDENFVVQPKIIPPKNRLELRKKTTLFFEESNRKAAQKYFDRDELFI